MPNKTYSCKLLALLLLLTTCSLIWSAEIDARYRTDKLLITGNSYLSRGKIRSLMETGERGLLGWMLFRKKPAFTHSELDADIVRVQRAYQREGYLNVEIIADVTISSGLASITLHIDEGTGISIAKIDYQLPGVSDPEPHQKLLDDIKEKSNLKQGELFKDGNLNDDLSFIRDFYDRSGFPYVKADYELTLNEENAEVQVTFIITPGRKGIIGDIRFEGLQRTNQKLLVRLIAFKTGDEYDRRKFDLTRTTLQSVGLFRLVSVSLSLDESAEKVPVEIYIREKDNITLNFGVGYGIEDKVRVYSEITKLRFLGGLRTGTLYLKHSSLMPVNVDLKVIQPVFPTIRSSVILNPFFRMEEEPAYSVTRLGVNTTLTHRLFSHTGAFLTYGFEDNKLTSGTDDLADGDPNEDAVGYRKSSISLGMLTDTSHPVFFPQRGNIISNILTFSGLGFNSDYQYLRMLSDVRHYQALGSSVVVAARIKGGFLEPLADDDFIPYEDRFYAGGAFSVRGWQRAQLGPLNSEGEPVGGKSSLEGSIELRYPIWRDLSLVHFIDSGNVWQNRFQHNFKDLRYAAGIGLRYATGVGPVRFDVAVPVFDEERSVQFFLSLGQMF